MNFRIAEFDLLDDDINAIEDFAKEKLRKEEEKERLKNAERLVHKNWEREKYLLELELSDKQAYYEVLKTVGATSKRLDMPQLWGKANRRFNVKR